MLNIVCNIIKKENIMNLTLFEEYELSYKAAKCMYGDNPAPEVTKSLLDNYPDITVNYLMWSLAIAEHIQYKNEKLMTQNQIELMKCHKDMSFHNTNDLSASKEMLDFIKLDWS